MDRLDTLLSTVVLEEKMLLQKMLSLPLSLVDCQVMPLEGDTVWVFSVPLPFVSFLFSFGRVDGGVAGPCSMRQTIPLCTVVLH